MPSWQGDEQTDKCTVTSLASKLQLSFCADALLDRRCQQFDEQFLAGSGQKFPDPWFLGMAVRERIKSRIPGERSSVLIEQNHQETRRFQEGLHAVLGKQTR